MSEITVLIFTRNERSNLSRLLPYLAKYVKYFVFIDGMSTDGTKEMCEKYGTVYQAKPIGWADPCRMYGIGKVATDWVFYLDADEYPSRELLMSLMNIIRYAEAKGYCAIRVHRINFVKPGKVLRYLFQPDYQVRLFKRGCVEYRGIVHEQPSIKGKVLTLGGKFAIYHRAYNTYSFKALKKQIFYA